MNKGIKGHKGNWVCATLWGTLNLTAAIADADKYTKFVGHRAPS